MNRAQLHTIHVATIDSIVRELEVLDGLPAEVKNDAKYQKIRTLLFKRQSQIERSYNHFINRLGKRITDEDIGELMQYAKEGNETNAELKSLGVVLEIRVPDVPYHPNVHSDEDDDDRGGRMGGTPGRTGCRRRRGCKE